MSGRLYDNYAKAIRKYIITSIIVLFFFASGIGVGYLWCLGHHVDKDAYISSKLQAGKEFFWDGHKIYPIKGYDKRWHYKKEEKK